MELSQQLITDIYNNPEIDECIAKLVDTGLRADFKQELFLTLCSVPCEKIISMNGSLKYFTVRIILNLVRQKRNVFHKTYLDKTVEYNSDKFKYETSSPADVDTMAERCERENREESIINRIESIDAELGNTSFPYHHAMVELLSKLGSVRAVSDETGIPLTTAQRTFKKIRQHLKS